MGKKDQRILPPIESDNFLLNIARDEKQLADFLLFSLVGGFLPATGTPAILLLGSDAVTRACLRKLEENKSEGPFAVSSIPLNFPEREKEISHADLVFISQAPDTGSDWRRVQNLLLRHPGKIKTLWSHLRDFFIYSQIEGPIEYLDATRRVWSAYHCNATENPIIRPVHDFNSVFPVKGKRILELGPLDGFQTAALRRCGARAITCVEIRPENYLKMLIAKGLNNWDNIHLLFENVHCLHPALQGVFDIVFAHGIYYHSNTPFHLLETLRRLGNCIFFGGFCATEESPQGPWEELSDGDVGFRVKPYREYRFFTNGVTSMGYFFHSSDLVEWFRKRNYTVEVIFRGDSGMPHIAGEYIRFVASK